MKKYRPKTQIMYSYGTLYTVNVWCYPQSRWEFLYETLSIVRLRNKNVALAITKEDFEKQWVEVKGDKA